MKMPIRRTHLMKPVLPGCILVALSFWIALPCLYAAPGDSEMELLSDSLAGKSARYTIPELEKALAWLRNNPIADERRDQLAGLCCDIAETGIVYKAQSGYVYGLDPRRRISQSALTVISTHKLTNALPRLLAYFVDQRFSHGETRQDVMQCVETLGAKRDLIRAVQLHWIELTLRQLPGSRRLNDEERKQLEQLTKEALQKTVDKTSGSHEAQTLLFKAVQFEDPSLAPVIVSILQKPKCHWILKQNGIRMLGNLQSEKSIPFLTEILKQPIPDGADPKDYGEVDAILRSQACMALGEIGNPQTVAFLERISEDEKEYARVRESAARKALADIEARIERCKILNHWIDVIEQQPDELHDYWIHVRNDRHYELSLKDAEAIRKRLRQLQQQLGHSEIS